MNMQARNRRAAVRMSALAVAFAIAGTAHADSAAVAAATLVATSAPAATDEDVEQRVGAELNAIMAELIESGAFGAQPGEAIALDIDTPARRVSDLGLLVDSTRSGDDGLHVLAVTPGGNAERIGLRAGDVVIALNGSSLAGANSAAALRQTVDALPDGSAMAFYVNRDGDTRTLTGTLSSVYLPAMRLTVGDDARLASSAAPAMAGTNGSAMVQAGCGRISDFDVAPRQQHLHAAKIISIDGVTPGPQGSRSYRVDAGTHVVKVAERIESRYLSFSDSARNAGVSSSHYKTLTIDVAPDTTVLVAARLDPDQRNNPDNGAYWQPVAWKQSAEACR